MRLYFYHGIKNQDHYLHGMFPNQFIEKNLLRASLNNLCLTYDIFYLIHTNSWSHHKSSLAFLFISFQKDSLQNYYNWLHRAEKEYVFHYVKGHHLNKLHDIPYKFLRFS